MVPIDLQPQELLIVKKILKIVLTPGANVWVFGSRARGAAKRGADLDLAFDLGRPFFSEEIYELVEAFDESDLPFRVDIVDLATVNDSFSAIIKNHYVPFPFLD